MDSGGDEPAPGSRPRGVATAVRGWGVRNRRALLWTAGVVLAAVAGYGLFLFLRGLWRTLDAMAGTDPRAQVTAVRTIVTIVLGLGGLVSLGVLIHRQVLQLRNQKHLEKTAEDARYDATEKRAQELFVQAVEQLGNEKAAVRIGALHALDALGQEHAHRRRAVMDVWCAYLRMPPPDAGGEAKRKGKKRKKGRGWPAEELQVRATALRLIGEHLRDRRSEEERAEGVSEPEAFWGAMDIDLSGAHLHDVRFWHCRFGSVSFKGVKFVGVVRFDGAKFIGDAWFYDTDFTGDAWFNGAGFAQIASFHGAKFTGGTAFLGAGFAEGAGFGDAKFSGVALFSDAVFSGHAEFDDAEFSGSVTFEDATFARPDLVDPGARLFLIFKHTLPPGWRAAPRDDQPGRVLEWDPALLEAAPSPPPTEPGND